MNRNHQSLITFDLKVTKPKNKWALLYAKLFHQKHGQLTRLGYPPLRSPSELKSKITSVIDMLVANKEKLEKCNPGLLQRALNLCNERVEAETEAAETARPKSTSEVLAGEIQKSTKQYQRYAKQPGDDDQMDAFESSLRMPSKASMLAYQGVKGGGRVQHSTNNSLFQNPTAAQSYYNSLKVKASVINVASSSDENDEDDDDLAEDAVEEELTEDTELEDEAKASISKVTPPEMSRKKKRSSTQAAQGSREGASKTARKLSNAKAKAGSAGAAMVDIGSNMSKIVDLLSTTVVAPVPAPVSAPVVAPVVAQPPVPVMELYNALLKAGHHEKAKEVLDKVTEDYLGKAS